MLDTIVIGGGFAGLVAARELGRRGYSVTLLEARERLGGRTWLAPFGGIDVEMGGAFVHRTQPHVWAELTRYGLGVVELPDAETSFLRTDDGVRELDLEEWLGLMEALRRMCHDAGSLVPDPMIVPSGEAAEAADRESLADRIEGSDLSSLERDMLSAIAAAMSSTTNDRVSYLWGLPKALALADLDPQAMFDANGRWVIAGGTGALVDAIAGDTPADVRLGQAVSAIAQGDGLVTVVTGDGIESTARTAVVALPVNALGRIGFEPGLSELKREAATTGLSSSGLKWWIKMHGKVGSVFAAAPDRFPISFIETAAIAGDGSAIALAFGPSAEQLPLADVDAVAAAVADLLPDVEVEDVGGHDWAADPLSGQTWATYRPGTYTRWAPELERTEGRVVFAGGDFARGWAGYIDGAIESGLRAARQVGELLG